MALNDQRILEKAIQKAIDGGYWVSSPWHIDPNTLILYETIDSQEEPPYDTETTDWHELIYDKDFAKAIWPNPPVISHKDREKLDKGEVVETKPYPFELQWWQWNLMQMVIADDPIKYLGEHL